mmetsp:Transcript_9803/g.19828  ORF Transcript_9803/g.19828 Transcript_9803/m.19828 type:complete len:300 (-) Transcript_9803:59-958(-)
MRTLPAQHHQPPANRPVVGVDDAGVGAIAGPVFAAAVLLPTNWQPIEAAVDSKLLSLEARRAAFEAVCSTPGLVWATAAVRAREVDLRGGHPATALAMEQAVARLEAKLRRRQARSCPAPNRSLAPAPRVFCLVDGTTLPVGLEGVALPGGDGTEAAIAAASVVASGARDAAMRALARRHPLWQLERHGGHANEAHLRLVVEHGPCVEHRLGCFPFARRFSRRMAYHPHRAAYKRVQEHLALAQDRAHAPADEGEAERLRRYRERLALTTTEAALVPSARLHRRPGETGGRRTRRRRGR